MQSPAATNVAGCPARETLVDFHLGKLPADDLEVVGAHLSTCPRCEVFLGELGPDDLFVARVRQCLVLPADAAAGRGPENQRITAAGARPRLKGAPPDAR
jgi:anti-sigma factor RsiW